MPGQGQVIRGGDADHATAQYDDTHNFLEKNQDLVKLAIVPPEA
jgi:hypothetical protein